MQKIVIELGEHELAALKQLARNTGQTLETAIEMTVAESLVTKGLISESAERDGKKFVRLDE